jgi:hypothetical protein
MRLLAFAQNQSSGHLDGVTGEKESVTRQKFVEALKGLLASVSLGAALR